MSTTPSNDLMDALARFHGNEVTELLRTWLQNGVPGEVVGDAKVLARLACDFEDRVQAIRSDQNLSAAGRQDAMTKAGVETLAAVDKWLAPRLRSTEERAASVRAEMGKAMTPLFPPDASARADAAVLRAEYRRIADGLSPLEVEQMFSQGDATVRAALTERRRVEAKDGGVSIHEYVPAETREVALVESVRSARPDLVKGLAAIAEVQERHQTVANFVASVVQRHAPRAVAPTRN